VTDTEDIRTLIEHWAEAVHRGELDTVLADHADDIVMFDVPPPHDGVRGLAAYRESWPGFFEWQASGALFEVVELDVTAGTDVAFAHALLRCGTPEQFDRVPEARLRLTVGLRKEGDRWVVTHEHHSFADVSQIPEVSEQEVRAVHDAWSVGTAANDLAALMSHIAPDVVSYEHAGAMEYVGSDAVREVCAAGLAAAPDGVEMETPGLTVRVGGDLAVSWGIDRIRIAERDGAPTEVEARGTRVFERREGEWLMVHQHLSHPENL
jgi:uncharacterized protein (TIGR02246 family)